MDYSLNLRPCRKCRGTGVFTRNKYGFFVYCQNCKRKTPLSAISEYGTDTAKRLAFTDWNAGMLPFSPVEVTGSIAKYNDGVFVNTERKHAKRSINGLIKQNGDAETE